MSEDAIEVDESPRDGSLIHVIWVNEPCPSEAMSPRGPCVKRHFSHNHTHVTKPSARFDFSLLVIENFPQTKLPPENAVFAFT